MSRNTDPEPHHVPQLGQQQQAARSPIVSAQAADGPFRNATRYVVEPGDTWAKIAYRFYGDADRGPELRAANAQRLPNPAAEPEPGTELTVPRHNLPRSQQWL